MRDNIATLLDSPTVRNSPSRIGLCALASTYFVFYAALGLLFPFLPLVLHSKGLADAQIALAMAMSGVSSLIAPNFFAHIADRFLSCRRLLPLLLTSNALALLLLTRTTTLLDSSTVIFLLFASLVPSLSMLDSFTLDIVKNQPPSATPPITFQRYRIWGSLGFIAPACLMIFLPDWRALTATDLLIIGASASIVAACIGLALPSNIPHRHNPIRPLYAAIQAAWKPPLRGVFLANAIAGMGLATFFIVFPRFLHELDFSAVEIGLITNVGVASEILMMPFIGSLISFIGLKAVIMLGFASIPLRLFSLAMYPSQTMVLLTQILHGPLVIGVFIALPMYLQEHADNSFRHSLQNLNITVSHGIARCLGPAIAALYFSSSIETEVNQLSLSFVAIGLSGILAVALCATPTTKNQQ
jgi:PPP family 3-phenylpropionic acid transporter